MAVYGYIRVSSKKQSCEHQHHEIQQFAKHNNINIDKWVEETITSRKPLNKRQLGQLLNKFQVFALLPTKNAPVVIFLLQSRYPRLLIRLIIAQVAFYLMVCEM